MVVLSLGFFVGVFLALIGAALCLYWYFYWERNFQGNLLTNGPYSVVRHPFYTGFINFVVGLTLVFPIYETRFLAVLTFAVMVVYIPREEEKLLQQYRDEYSMYIKKVKWKLVPYLY